MRKCHHKTRLHTRWPSCGSVPFAPTLTIDCSPGSWLPRHESRKAGLARFPPWEQALNLTRTAQQSWPCGPELERAVRWSGQAEGRAQFSLPTMLTPDSSRGKPGQRLPVCWSSQLCRADRVKCFVKSPLVRRQPPECGKPGLKRVGDLTLLGQCRSFSSRGHTLPIPQCPKAAGFLSA